MKAEVRIPLETIADHDPRGMREVQGVGLDRRMSKWGREKAVSQERVAELGEDFDKNRMNLAPGAANISKAGLPEQNDQPSQCRPVPWRW